MLIYYTFSPTNLKTFMSGGRLRRGESGSMLLVIQAVPTLGVRPLLGGRGERSEEEVTIIEYLLSPLVYGQEN